MNALQSISTVDRLQPPLPGREGLGVGWYGAGTDRDNEPTHPLPLPSREGSRLRFAPRTPFVQHHFIKAAA